MKDFEFQSITIFHWRFHRSQCESSARAALATCLEIGWFFDIFSNEKMGNGKGSKLLKTYFSNFSFSSTPTFPSSDASHSQQQNQTREPHRSWQSSPSYYDHENIWRQWFTPFHQLSASGSAGVMCDSAMETNPCRVKMVSAGTPWMGYMSCDIHTWLCFMIARPYWIWICKILAASKLMTHFFRRWVLVAMELQYGYSSLQQQIVGNPHESNPTIPRIPSHVSRLSVRLSANSVHFLDGEPLLLILALSILH